MDFARVLSFFELNFFFKTSKPRKIAFWKITPDWGDHSFIVLCFSGFGVLQEGDERAGRLCYRAGPPGGPSRRQRHQTWKDATALRGPASKVP